MNRTQTALVLKSIPRDELGTNARGNLAETFDRVYVLKTRRFSNGGRQHQCRTRRGETFYANDNMVQVDKD